MAKSEKKKTVSKKINPNGALKVPGTNVSMLSGLEPLLIPISDVSPDPANPRRVKDLGALVGSLKRFGLRKPIVANGRNNIIEAGHQTHHAMTELGATHIPVLWADDDGLTATAFNIADNRTGEIVAEWDDEILAKLLSELNDEDCIDDIGFSQQQVEGLISSFVDHEIKDDDDLPATPFDDDDEGGGVANRVIIVYDNDSQKASLEKKLGAKIEKVLYHFDELIKGGDDAI